MSGRAPRLELTGAPPETEFAETVAQFMHKMVLPPAEWTLVNAGHIQLTKAQAAKLNRLGLRRGWPDYLVLHRQLYGIELKHPNGRLSKGYMARTARGGLIWREGQTEVFPRLEAAGMTIAVCTSLDAVIGALKGWDIPMRRFT